MALHKRRKIACFLAVLLAIGSAVFPAAAAAADGPADVTEIDIGIRPAAYQKLISSEETEPRFPVQISVNGGALFSGKLKLRGASSKAMGLSMPGKRLPLQLKLDQTDLLAGTLDNSCVKMINAYTPLRLLGEYLALEMYDFLQIPAPAHALVFLQFNGVDFGLYLAAEDVNEEFLRKNDPDGGGSLFKADDQYDEADHAISSWFGSLQITENRGMERYGALIDALDSGAGYGDYLDVDEALRYFACLAAWGANSTILTEQNNFFLYDTGEKFILIPWDNSEAFAAYDTGNGIDRYKMEQWQKEDRAPALFTLLMADETNKEIYHGYIRQINEGFLAPERLDPYFNALAALVHPYLQRDCTMLFNHPYKTPVAPVEEYGTVNALLETLHRIHENLSDQLDGTADGFYVNPVYSRIVNAGNDPNAAVDFLVRNSPTIDPDITDKICAAYPAWCRAQGRIPFDADDPAEIAVCAAVLITAFFLISIFDHKKAGKKKPQEASDG